MLPSDTFLTTLGVAAHYAPLIGFGLPRSGAVQGKETRMDKQGQVETVPGQSSDIFIIPIEDGLGCQVTLRPVLQRAPV